MSLNRVILIGRLGKDPEAKDLANDKTVAKFSVATDEGFGDKKHTEWHNIVAWGKTAQFARDYLRKGREVCVEGRISTRSYEKDGEKKYVTEITADRVLFVGPPPESDRKGSKPKPSEDNDDIPNW